MKTHFRLFARLAVSVVVILGLVSCGGDEPCCKKDVEKKDSLSCTIFNHVNEYRSVCLPGDTVNLYPFELFALVQYDSTECMDICFLHFTVLDTLQTVLREDSMEMEYCPYRSLAIPEENIKENAQGSLTIVFETIDKKLVRTVEPGKKYKLIYSYRSDSECLRTNIPTEHFSDYYIVDIVEVDGKFMRQLDFYEEANTDLPYP